MIVLAYIINGLILITAVPFAVEGGVDNDPGQFASAFGLIALLNIVALWRAGRAGKAGTGKGLFSLYLKRKRLEQLNRIAELEGKSGD